MWNRIYPILMYYGAFFWIFCILFGPKGLLITIPVAFLFGMLNEIIRGLKCRS